MDAQVRIDGLDLSPPAPGRLLPPGAFTSPAVYAAELDRIFGQSWVHVADLPALRHPGDYVTGVIGATPVVVARGYDGVLRGFLNVCPHRGATVAEGAGNCGRHFRCPYHAWSFGTDGRLIGLPSREELACDLGERNLLPIRVATTGPMVFGCLDPDAPPFEEWAGELPAALARARADEMELAFECTYDVPVNWKVYVENGLEGYHVPVVHDLLNDFVDTRSARHFLEEHSSYSHALIKASYRELMPPAPPHLGPEETACSRFGLVFPNLIPVVTPVDFSYLRIDPVACDRIRLVGRSFDLGGAYAGEFRAFRREAFDRTNQQDIAVVIRVQRGLAARGFEGGVYAAFLECRIGHFERLVSRALTYGARVAVPPLAEAEPITYERVTGARGTAVA